MQCLTKQNMMQYESTTLIGQVQWGTNQISAKPSMMGKWNQLELVLLFLGCVQSHSRKPQCSHLLDSLAVKRKKKKPRKQKQDDWLVGMALMPKDCLSFPKFISGWQTAQSPYEEIEAGGGRALSTITQLANVRNGTHARTLCLRIPCPCHPGVRWLLSIDKMLLSIITNVDQNHWTVYFSVFNKQMLCSL